MGDRATNGDPAHWSGPAVMSPMRCALVRALTHLMPVAPAACQPTSDRPDVTSAALLPAMRWDHRPEADRWTLATLAALRAEGAVLETTVPADIAPFCPAHEDAPPADRRAFWAGFLSRLPGMKAPGTRRPGAAAADGSA